MIITGNFYQTTDQQNSTGTSSNTSTKATAKSVQADSLEALKTFFDDGSDSGDLDNVSISQQALSVLENYVSSNGTTDEDPLLDLIKENAQSEYMNSDDEDKSAMDSLAEYLSAFNEKEMQEVYAKIKDANSQLSGDFISSAARYGVQSLL